MKSMRIIGACILAFVVSLAIPVPASAQFGKLKDKIKKEAAKQVPTTPKPEQPKPSTEGEADTVATKVTGDSAVADADDFQLYTKFDFVPGQKVLFFDDLSGEEMGEFPSRWKLTSGVFEIAKVGADPWIMASAHGQISPKINVNQIPERYTVEFEFLNRTSVYTGAYDIEFQWLGADDNSQARLNLFTNTTGRFYMITEQGGIPEVSSKPLPAGFAKGIHSIRLMVTKSSIKGFVDNERLVNAPKPANFSPVGFAIAIHGDDADFEKEKIFIRNFRFAEGGKTMREQLDESGHVVTHGIYFDVNSDRVRGESYKTLADIAQMLTDDATLKLMIEGHTDSDGNDASNLELSDRRAKSVRQYLIDNYKVAADRLESKGLGETRPIDANTTPEGKANNRRVELVKL